MRETSSAQGGADREKDGQVVRLREHGGRQAAEPIKTATTFSRGRSAPMNLWALSISVGRTTASPLIFVWNQRGYRPFARIMDWFGRHKTFWVWRMRRQNRLANEG